MDISIALQRAISLLAHTPIPSNITSRVRLEAEILLGFVLEKERVWLHAYHTHTLSRNEQERFFSLIEKRVKGCPIEYLTHRVSFLDFDLFVDSSVLIPRPESEILVQKVCEIIDTNQLHYAQLIEVGVGSGALSIAIARAFPQISIIATDISQEAIKTAMRNIEHFGLQDRITLKHIAFFDRNNHADIIFSNPPYIASSYPIDKSLTYEPSSALFGGDIGSEILEELIIRCNMSKIPYLACEIGYDQKAHLAKTLQSNNYQARFYTDLAKLDRGFVARFQN